MALRGGGLERILEGDAVHACHLLADEIIRRCLNHLGDVGIGRAAMGGIVLEAPVLGRVVRWRDHHAIGQIRAAVTVIGQDGMRDDGGWRITILRINTHFQPGCGKHFQRGFQRRAGEGMRIDADEQRTGDARVLPVIDNRLADGQDMLFIEAGAQRGTPMSRCAKGTRCVAMVGSGLRV